MIGAPKVSICAKHITLGYIMLNIERINELAKKAKTVGLTEEEKKEQALLRRAYIDSVVGNLRANLDNTYVVENGQEVKLTARKSDDNQ